MVPAEDLSTYPPPRKVQTNLVSLVLGSPIFDNPEFYLAVYSRYLRVFPGGPVVKNLPAMQKTQVQSLSWEPLLEEGMTTHFSILIWRIP